MGWPRRGAFAHAAPPPALTPIAAPTADCVSVRAGLALHAGLREPHCRVSGPYNRQSARALINQDMISLLRISLAACSAIGPGESPDLSLPFHSSPRARSMCRDMGPAETRQLPWMSTRSTMYAVPCIQTVRQAMQDHWKWISLLRRRNRTCIPLVYNALYCCALACVKNTSSNAACALLIAGLMPATC